ncbi:uncharacterized protein ACB058_009937 [Synchiropus picturatus]
MTLSVEKYNALRHLIRVQVQANLPSSVKPKIHLLRLRLSRVCSVQNKARTLLRLASEDVCEVLRGLWQPSSRLLPALSQSGLATLTCFTPAYVVTMRGIRRPEMEHSSPAPAGGLTSSTTLDDPEVLLYSALAVSLLLLLTSLSLALFIFMRRKRRQPGEPARTERKHYPQRAVRLGHGVREQCVAKSKHQPADPCPTETCVCVHCFPELSAPAHRPNFHQPALQQPVDQQGPLWTQQRMRTESAREEQEEAAGAWRQ